MGNFKLFVLNLLTNKMEVDGHMLHAAVRGNLSSRRRWVSQLVLETVAATVQYSASVEE